MTRSSEAEDDIDDEGEETVTKVVKKGKKEVVDTCTDSTCGWLLGRHACIDSLRQ